MITKADMIHYLGRGMSVFFTDGSGIYFKANQYNGNTGEWTGIDDEGMNRTIKGSDIEIIRYSYENKTLD